MKTGIYFQFWLTNELRKMKYLKPIAYAFAVVSGIFLSKALVLLF